MRRVVLAMAVAALVGVIVGAAAMFAPADATVDFAFRCRDGTISTASTSQGACSHHGGIAGQVPDSDVGTAPLATDESAAGGSGTPTVVNCGTAAVGQTVACDLPGLPASTAITKFVNGTGGEPGTSSAAGTAHFTVQVLSQTAGILGDPKNVTLQCGTNTLSATGGGVTSSGTFTLSCPAAVPAAAPSSSVAFTGANIALGATGGSALVATGAFLVWGARRRRAA